MSEHLSAAGMKDLLIEVVTVQLRTARADLGMDPNDQGNPETGRMSSADSVRLSARLLREMEAVPADDPRIVRLTELVPSVDLLLAAIPDDATLSADDGADAFLDSLVGFAVKATGSAS
jgi:hypothetical protein